MYIFLNIIFTHLVALIKKKFTLSKFLEFFFQCDVEFTLVKVIDSTVEGDLPTSMAWYKAGLLVSGPNHGLRVSFFHKGK